MQHRRPDAGDSRERKAHLGARQRMLRLGQDGMKGLVGEPGAVAAEIERTEADLEQTVEGCIEAKASLATWDGRIVHVEAVLGHAKRHVKLHRTALTVDRMGSKVEAGAAGPVNAFDLTELAIGAGLKAVIAIVCCARGALSPEVSRLAQGERYL
jgi:hypothetical protein